MEFTSQTLKRTQFGGLGYIQSRAAAITVHPAAFPAAQGDAYAYEPSLLPPSPASDGLY